MYEIHLCVDLGVAMIPNWEFGRKRVGHVLVVESTDFWWV